MLPSLGSTKRFEYDGTFGGLNLSSFGMLEKKPIAPSSQAAWKSLSVEYLDFLSSEETVPLLQRVIMF